MTPAEIERIERACAALPPDGQRMTEAQCRTRQCVTLMRIVRAARAAMAEAAEHGHYCPSAFANAAAWGEDGLLELLELVKGEPS